MQGKILYFDVDGTILPRNSSRAKSCLAGGLLESALREAGFTAMVCVGNYASIAHMTASIDPGYDSLGTLFRMLSTAFTDEGWFRSVTSLVVDAGRRAEHIPFEGDWWYVDDYAPDYLDTAGKSHLLSGDLAHRICIPAPNGDGSDIIDWIRSSARADDDR
jgi:hypothetical protein